MTEMPKPKRDTSTFTDEMMTDLRHMCREGLPSQKIGESLGVSAKRVQYVIKMLQIERVGIHGVPKIESKRSAVPPSPAISKRERNGNQTLPVGDAVTWAAVERVPDWWGTS